MKITKHHQNNHHCTKQ